LLPPLPPLLASLLKPPLLLFSLPSGATYRATLRPWFEVEAPKSSDTPAAPATAAGGTANDAPGGSRNTAALAPRFNHARCGVRKGAQTEKALRACNQRRGCIKK
jgi:hypothetical protein